MKSTVRTEVDAMQETIREAANATPKIIEAEARIAGYKASLWAAAWCFVAFLFLFGAIPFVIFWMKVGQAVWQWNP